MTPELKEVIKDGLMILIVQLENLRDIINVEIPTIMKGHLCYTKNKKRWEYCAAMII